MQEKLSEENRRAIRILGYNNIEITQNSLNDVKQMDALLQSTLSLLTPQNVLKMIRDQVNPLEMDLYQLNE